MEKIIAGNTVDLEKNKKEEKEQYLPKTYTLNRIALLNEVTPENKWLVNNGIYFASRLGKFHSNPNKGLEVVTQAMHMYPRLSEPYFVAVEQITTNYNGKDYSGNTVDLEKIRKRRKRAVLTKNVYI